jgi:hypothetical protein
MSLTAELRGAILQLLLGDLTSAKQAAETIERLAAWDSAITVCEEWKVLPQLRKRVGECGARLPESSRIRLHDVHSKAFIRTAKCITGGADAMATLLDRGIPCAAFKGFATLAYLHTGPAQRTLQDVDILVPPSKMRPALEVLESVGYVRSVGGTLDEYIAFVQRSPVPPGMKPSACLTIRAPRSICTGGWAAWIRRPCWRKCSASGFSPKKLR